MTLLLYAHPLSSYCWKVLIPLYENRTAFEFRQLDQDHPENGAEFAALWPLAKMPVLADNGRAVAESSVIIDYLDLHHPGPVRMVPAETEAALEVRLLDRVFDNYVMAPVQKIVFDRFRPEGTRNPADQADGRALLDKAYGWLEQRLAGRTWAAGDAFGLADCAAAPSLHYADKVHAFRDRFPALAAYLGRLEARPSVARVLREAEPYAHMFPQEPA
jgi:glutathione S-transferase